MKALIAITICMFTLKSFTHGLQCWRLRERKEYKIEALLSFIVVAICFLILFLSYKVEFYAILEHFTM